MQTTLIDGSIASNSPQLTQSADQPQEPSVKKIRILVCGDSGVGRRALIDRFVQNDFQPGFHESNNQVTKQITLNNKKVELIIGSNYYTDVRDARNNFSSGIQGVILVYDPKDQVSFNNISVWSRLVDQNCSENCKRILVSTKNDQKNDKIVDNNTAKDYATENNMDFIETSSKTGDNIQLAFERLVSHIIHDTTKTEERPVQASKAPSRRVWAWERCMPIIKPALFAIAGIITLIAATKIFAVGAGVALSLGLVGTSLGAFSLAYRSFKHI